MATASFVVQTHIGYAALALPLLAWGVAWVVAIARRRRETADLLRSDHRRLDAEAVRQRLVVAADADVDALGGRPGLELIAYHGRLSYTERRARLETLTEVAPEGRLEATAALGPALAVFAEDPA